MLCVDQNFSKIKHTFRGNEDKIFIFLINFFILLQSNVGKRLDLLWKFLKPVSFSLIGKEINFAVLDGKVVGYGVLLVLLGSVVSKALQKYKSILNKGPIIL